MLPPSQIQVRVILSLVAGLVIYECVKDPEPSVAFPWVLGAAAGVFVLTTIVDAVRHPLPNVAPKRAEVRE